MSNMTSEGLLILLTIIGFSVLLLAVAYVVPNLIETVMMSLEAGVR